MRSSFHLNLTVRAEEGKVVQNREEGDEKKEGGKKRKASKNSYNSYQDGGIYSPHSGVPLRPCSNLESH